MQKKSEIDLKLVPDSGKAFTFDQEDLKDLEDINEVAVQHLENKIRIEIKPIGQSHFEVNAHIQLKVPLNCYKCGEELEKSFDEKATDYLSLENEKEGEDKGFLVLESSRWKWTNFIRETVLLETSYEFFDCGGNCSLDKIKASQEGFESLETEKKNPFEALKKIKNKLN
jgi:uncharacterized metal-binding protein YceD (DUF177 family)